jgi:uroporphyrinogen decarboxylase
MPELRHRDRVLMALSHEEPDRCPMHISYAPEFAARLRAAMDLQKETPDDRGRGRSYKLERALGQDLIYTAVGFNQSRYDEVREGDSGRTYVDEWGVTWKDIAYHTPFGTGHYREIVGHPLTKEEAVSAYEPPDPQRPELYTEAQRVITEYKDEYWIVGGTVNTIFETAWALRGLETTLKDLVRNPELSERLFDIPFNYHLTAAKKLVEMGTDMIQLGDDMGTQEAMLISPATWRRFFKPRMATFISTLKRINPEVKIDYHSDGVIYPIISDLIEIGVDVLNPVQPKCMDPQKLKKEYGGRLCFRGSIDEQRTLPFASPGEVKQEVLTRLRTLGRDGGLIIGPSHIVQLDTPLDNFWAMVDTIRETSYAAL